MGKPKKNQCAECGYEWVHGQDGNHSCIRVLKDRIVELEEGITRIIKGAY